MKIYCKDCKHYWSLMRECYEGLREVEDFHSKRLVRYLASVKNRNNDCPSWSPNRRFRLARWLKKGENNESLL